VTRSATWNRRSSPVRATAVRALVAIAAGAVIAGCDGGGGGGGTGAATTAAGGASSAPRHMSAAEAAKELAPILARARAGGSRRAKPPVAIPSLALASRNLAGRARTSAPV
jgi:hypothetical protein